MNRNKIKNTIKDCLHYHQGSLDGNIENLIDVASTDEFILDLVSLNVSKYDAEIRDGMFIYKGQQMFCVKDYNLLYNLTRICEALKEELR